MHVYCIYVLYVSNQLLFTIPRITNMTINEMDQSLTLSVIEVCVYGMYAYVYPTLYIYI